MRLTYSTSAAHYLRDQRAGRPWSSKLPTHVVVVDRHEVIDHIGGTRSATGYQYREGHFDGKEREFRGFGLVDVYDAVMSSDDTGEGDVATPTLTRNWFHLGTAMWGEHRPRDTYAGDSDLPRIPHHAVESAKALAENEADDAFRVLAGRVLRREVYSLDDQGRRALHPFEVHQAGYRIRQIQPALGSTRPAWSVIPGQELAATYEQEADDPRLTHRITVETDAYDQVVREADVAYARRTGRARDIAAQGSTSVVMHDHGLTNIDEPNRFELGIPVEGKDYELLGLPMTPGSLLTRDHLRASDIVGVLAAPRPHHEEPAGLAARLLSWEKSFYWNDDRAATVPFGSIGAVTLIHHEEAACFAPGFAVEVYGARVGADRLAALGYGLRDSYYWKRDEVHHFASRDLFFQRVAIEARDGGRTTFTYDRHGLELIAVEDAFGNRSTAEIDYHLLAPWRVTDPNGSVSEVRYDPLGVIVVETNYGTMDGAAWGFDALTDVEPRPPPDLTAVLADPGRYLQGAARSTSYDLEAWQRARTPTTAVTLVREDLRHDGRGSGTADGRIQVLVSYLDGLGRTLQTKTLVEPGPAIQRGPDGAVTLDAAGHPVLAPADERWLVSGHVQYDAKQHPIRSYEPFFSSTRQFEGDEVLQRFGVASLTVYDGLGRVVGQHLPNGTFTRTTYQAWAIVHEDVNDTVLQSAYRVMRERLLADDPERQAFEHARAHAGTATTTFLNPQGQTVVSLARGGAGEDRRTEQRLDGSGQVREVVDPRGLVAFRYQRDMEGRVLFTQSIDAGDAWSLPDADDRMVLTWNGRGVEVEVTFDRLDRITATHVRGPGLDHRVEERVYGESVPDGAARNLLGRLVTVRDQAGESSVERYDPAGQILRSVQRLRTDLGEPDWRTPVALDAERFASETFHDALGRPRREVLPDGTVRATDYLRGGGIERVRLTTPDGRLSDVSIVDGADFDARGQRRRVRLGNGVEVTYGYDRETTRLAIQTARLGSRRFQDLRYIYDPVGNLVRLEDLAHEPGPASLIQGTIISARRDYTYDAHYRLTRATGRVHQALLEHDYIPGVGTIKGTRHLSLNNGAALERFTQAYEYDASNNIRRMGHAGATRSWATEMWVSPSSNRSLPSLDSGGIPIPDPESRFDAAGHLVSLAHLRRVDWSWRGTLARALVIERAGGTDDDEAYTYGADGMRMRKVTTRVVSDTQAEVTEKVYFGISERKRLLRNGAVILERWTTHVSDGQGRIALVHRWVRDDQRRETDDPGRPRILYQLTTHQNSGAIELDESGDLVSYEEYFPYGGTAFIAGDRARDIERREYRYMGKERDDATSLYYYGHRYYAPWMRRWLSPDPIGPADDLNLYQFVLGNPVNLIDIDGLQTTQATTSARPQIQYIPFESLPIESQTSRIRQEGHYWLRDQSILGLEAHSISEIFERAAQSHAVVHVYSPVWQRIYEATGGNEELATEATNRFTGQWGHTLDAPDASDLNRAVGSASHGEPDPESNNQGRAIGSSESASRQNTSTASTPRASSGSGSSESSRQRAGTLGPSNRGHQDSTSDQNRTHRQPGPTHRARPEGHQQGHGNGSSTAGTGNTPAGTRPQSGHPLGGDRGASNGVLNRSLGTEAPPPNQLAGGQNPAASYRGSDHGQAEGTSHGTSTGTDQNYQIANRTHGPSRVPGGSPQGDAGPGWELLGNNYRSNPPTTTPDDYLYSLARVAMQDFPEDDHSAQGGGMPGGRGKIRINRRDGQILHLAYQIAIRRLLAGLLGIALGLLVGLVRGAIALALLRRFVRVQTANMAGRQGQNIAGRLLGSALQSLRMVRQAFLVRRCLREVMRDYSQILQAEPENFGSLSVWGRRTRNGGEYSVHIILIRDANVSTLGSSQTGQRGYQSMLNMRSFGGQIMTEARAAGATTVRIYGHMVEHPSFLNERLPRSLGFPQGLVRISENPKIVATLPYNL